MTDHLAGGCDWPARAAPPVIGSGEVHVWFVDLGPLPRAPDARVPDAQRPAPESDPLQLLDDAERERAARYYFERDRTCFIRTRTALRQLLARYLQTDPRAITFELGRHKKPRLAMRDNPHDLQFNVTHSGAAALLAFASGQEIGIDVEQHRTLSDLKPLVRRYFSPREADLVCGLPVPAAEWAFLRIWTRKEAVMKATGQGLYLPPESFEVLGGGETASDLAEPLPESSATPLAGAPRPLSAEAGGERWSELSLFDLAVGAGHRAALASTGPLGEVRQWCWTSTG